MIMIYLSRPREWTVAGVTSGTSLVQLRPSDQVGYQPINRLLNMRPVLRSRSVFYRLRERVFSPVPTLTLPLINV